MLHGFSNGCMSDSYSFVGQHFIAGSAWKYSHTLRFASVLVKLLGNVYLPLLAVLLTFSYSFCMKFCLFTG